MYRRKETGSGDQLEGYSTWILGDEAEVIVIRQTHVLTCRSYHHLLLFPSLQLFLSLFLFQLLSWTTPVFTRRLPVLFTLLFSCFSQLFGVTVGCTASCLLSPCTTGSDSSNDYISCSLLCAEPPASSAEPQEFLSADQSNPASPEMLLCTFRFPISDIYSLKSFI